MKWSRVRIGTLMLLVVIVGLAIRAYQAHRLAIRFADLQGLIKHERDIARQTRDALRQARDEREQHERKFHPQYMPHRHPYPLIERTSK